MRIYPVALVLRRTLCAVLAASAVGLVPVRMTHAEMISTQESIDGSAASARAELGAWLERSDVRAELERLGVDPDEAAQRIASLSDAEVRAIHGRVSELPAGANFAAAVAGVLVVTVTVLLFTDLLGYTDVFPFVRPLPDRNAALQP